MPESSNMEDLMHQKMQQFELEPDPADWNAIYERLHKKRRRFIFWWLLPLAGALLIGGGLYLGMRQPDSANSVPAIANKVNANNASSSTTSTSTATVPVPNTTATETTPTVPADVIANDGGAIANKIPATENKKSASVNKESASANKIPATTDKNTAITSKRSSGANKIAATTNRKSAIANPVDEADAGGSAAVPTSAGKPAEQLASATPLTAIPLSSEQAEMPTAARSPETVDQNITRTMPPVAGQLMAPKAGLPALQEPEQQSIPNLSTHKDKGLYLGAYAGGGIHIPGMPVSSTKAMDLNAGPSGGYNYNQSSSYFVNGAHFNAGMVVQKKNKKFELSLGIGIQSNTWTQGYTIFQDSILPSGALFSRTNVATKESRYRQAAIEFPLLAGFRLAQRGVSSFWFNAGLNNTLTLYVKELNSTISGSPVLSGGNLTDPLTSPVNKYHPMLRLGFAYDHAGNKSHWQLMPTMQYSLNNVIQNGNADIRMLQLGLQFRYYFRHLTLGTRH